MALADTARLIAALELQDKFSRPAANAERSMGGLERRMSGLQGGAARLSQGIGSAIATIAKIGVGVGVGGLALLATQIKAGVDSLYELESVTVATETALKSTQGVSGQTADGIRAMSEAFEDLNATMDDKVIQSGANLLLTFTNIREKAFEPALEAALNMNEVMGGGPEGLESTIIQVGKALNDPIKGVTALRRVGVQLSSQQEEQIRTLVEQNDLYGAQQVILGELATQFGGQFAAAGDTAAGSQARLADRIEDVQKKLAGPLLPAIERVRDRLIDFLGSDTVLRGAERLGETIAGFLTDERIERGASAVEGLISKISTADFSGVGGTLSTVAGSLRDLPWQAIGDAAKVLGSGSRALLQAFTDLPPWVQTAVLTGWGLNKLTGGALGSIVSELGRGLIKGILNMNAAVVNVRGAVVNGPGGVGTGGGAPAGGGGGSGGGLLGAAQKIIGAATLAAIAAEFGDEIAAAGQNLHEEWGIADPPRWLTDFLNTPLVPPPLAPGAIPSPATQVQPVGGRPVPQFGPIVLEREPTATDREQLGELIRIRNVQATVATISDQQKSELQRHTGIASAANDRLNNLPDTATTISALSAIERPAAQLPSIAEGIRTKAAEQAQRQAEALAAVRGGNATLAQIRDKRTAVTVQANVYTTVNLSAAQAAAQIISYQKSISGATLE